MLRAGMVCTLALTLAACGGRARPTHTLELPYLVGAVAIDGKTVVVAPMGHSGQMPQPTKPLLVWGITDGSRHEIALPHCDYPVPVALVRRRVAVDCDNSCCDSSDVEIRTGTIDGERLTPLMRRLGGVGGGDYAAGPVPSWGGMAFQTWSETAAGTMVVDRLWSLTVRDGGEPEVGAFVGGYLVAGSRSSVALLRREGTVRIVRGFGTIGRVRIGIPSLAYGEVGVIYSKGREIPVAVDGVRLLVMLRDTLRVFDARTGSSAVVLRLPRPATNDAFLAAADGFAAVADRGRLVVIRLSDRAHRTIRLPVAPRLFVDRYPPGGFYSHWPIIAAIGANGIVYAYNVADPKLPGRVVFVPRAELFR